MQASQFSDSIPATVTHALTNQPAPSYSLSAGNVPLGAIPPAISISPGGGKYSRYIQPVISTSATGYYRFSPAEPWTVSTATPLNIPGGTLLPATVEYYAEDAASGLKSPVFSATYTFDGLTDSDGDGVPDFVELASGISDPTAGADTDEDGYDDITELLAGTDPTITADKPSPENRLTTRGTYDLIVAPFSLNPANTDSRPLPAGTGTNIRAFSLQGELLAQSATPSDSSSARLLNLPASPRGAFNVIETDLNFNTRALGLESPNGREILLLSPIPDIKFRPFRFESKGGTQSQQATEWLNEYSSYLAGRDKPTITLSYNYLDTLVLLLTERSIALKLQALEPGYDADSLTLTPARDPGLELLPEVAFRALRTYHPDVSPAFTAQRIYETIDSEIRNPTDSRVSQLVELAQEIYRLSADPNVGQPGEFPSPVDTLRALLRNSPADFAPDQPPLLPGKADTISYAANVSLSDPELRQANNALAFILQQIPARTDTLLEMTVTSETFSQPVPVLSSNGALFALFDNEGFPFRFPTEYRLPPGSRLRVRAFTDVPGLPVVSGATGLEVITAEILGYPTPSASDKNGNLLDDTWQAFFFPQSGSISPFADQDGDVYSNLQEFLEKTDPTLSSSRPSSTKLPLAPPSLEIAIENGSIELTTDYPTEFSDQIQFSLQTSESLTYFAPSTITAIPEGLSTYRITMPKPAAEKRFYRFIMGLKESSESLVQFPGDSDQ